MERKHIDYDQEIDECDRRLRLIENQLPEAFSQEIPEEPVQIANTSCPSKNDRQQALCLEIFASICSQLQPEIDLLKIRAGISRMDDGISTGEKITRITSLITEIRGLYTKHTQDINSPLSRVMKVFSEWINDGVYRIKKRERKKVLEEWKTLVTEYIKTAIQKALLSSYEDIETELETLIDEKRMEDWEEEDRKAKESPAPAHPGQHYLFPEA